MSIARILVKLNSINNDTSMSIARILDKLNIINNDTSTIIAHILVRINSMKNDIGSLGAYLLFVEGDVVAGGDGRSSNSSGGTLPLKMRRAYWRQRQHPDVAYER
jgi:hypothetical protein